MIFSLWEGALRADTNVDRARDYERRVAVLDAESEALYGLEQAQTMAQSYADMIVAEFERVGHTRFVFEAVSACEGYYGDRPLRLRRKIQQLDTMA